MNKVFVAIHATLFIAWPGINDRSVGEHGTSLVWDIKDVSMAFLALFIFKRGIGSLAVLFMIIGFLGKMNDDIPDAMHGLGIEEVVGIMGGRQMAVHAVGHESLGVIHMGGGCPCVVGKPDFMAPCAELGCRGAYHGVIGYAENGKGDDNSKGDKNCRLDKLSPGRSFTLGRTTGCFHEPSVC
jgi:hypothetical protein